MAFDMESSIKISVVIPAKNEADSLGPLVCELCSMSALYEVIVVDDGSTDDTAAVAKLAGAKVVSHPYSKGNGASIKSGVRCASGAILLFMDGDGQHLPSEIDKLISDMSSGYDMVVGARNRSAQENWWRSIANSIYNRLSSWMVGHTIQDLTSGFRLVDAEKFKKFLSLLPNGFSYPTTSTMAFFRAGYSVSYVPVKVQKRGRSSHINIWKDGLRFFLIIFKVGTLYSPLKLFFPVSMFFFLAGAGNYIYTYWSGGRFTNMSVLLEVLSILFFLMGLVSEQLTAIFYKDV